MAFNYSMGVSVEPQRVLHGATLHFEAKVTEPSENVGKVYLEVLGFGMKTKMKAVEGRYTYDFEVPRAAPKGSYTFNFYAVSETGEKGPGTTAQAQVI